LVGKTHKAHEYGRRSNVDPVVGRVFQNSYVRVSVASKDPYPHDSMFYNKLVEAMLVGHPILLLITGLCAYWVFDRAGWRKAMISRGWLIEHN
jgi:hypothetical protein